MFGVASVRDGFGSDDFGSGDNAASHARKTLSRPHARKIKKRGSERGNKGEKGELNSEDRLN